MNPAVIGTDVVDRKVVDGVLHTHRLVGSTWYFPRWTQSVSEFLNEMKKFAAIISQVFASKIFTCIRKFKCQCFVQYKYSLPVNACLAIKYVYK